MIDNPIRGAFESIDSDAVEEFREALRGGCLADLNSGDVGNGHTTRANASRRAVHSYEGDVHVVDRNSYHRQIQKSTPRSWPPPPPPL